MDLLTARLKKHVSELHGVSGASTLSGLQSACNNSTDSTRCGTKNGDLKEGPFAAIATKLEESLKKEGVERFGEVGEPFDPNIHEAVMQQPTSEVEPDHISMVLRYGYRVKERVVRTAQVAVAVAE